MENIPQEIGGTHYQQGVTTSPWDLQKVMKTSGSPFVDARRCDIIKYAFRVKGSLDVMLMDLHKIKHCAEAAIAELETLAGKCPLRAHLATIWRHRREF
jgi:hypothetical protein